MTLWYHTVPIRQAGVHAAQGALPAIRNECHNPVQHEHDEDQAVRRKRILDAAFSTFMKHGYAEASTLEIATRARVSKRAIYEIVGTKQELLAACVSEAAKRFRSPGEIPAFTNRADFAQALTATGAHIIREVSDPRVIAVFRLAIAEAVTAPEAARALDSIGREASRAALIAIMTRAASAHLVRGNPVGMAEEFVGLLWGYLMVSLFLGVADRPNEGEAMRRAHEAATKFLKIY
jgi:AcrR family transcriptional regulator